MPAQNPNGTPPEIRRVNGAGPLDPTAARVHRAETAVTETRVMAALREAVNAACDALVNPDDTTEQAWAIAHRVYEVATACANDWRARMTEPVFVADPVPHRVMTVVMHRDGTDSSPWTEEI